MTINTKLQVYCQIYENRYLSVTNECSIIGMGGSQKRTTM